MRFDVYLDYYENVNPLRRLHSIFISRSSVMTGEIFFAAMDKMVQLVKFQMIRYNKIQLDHIFKSFMTTDSFSNSIFVLNSP